MSPVTSRARAILRICGSLSTRLPAMIAYPSALLTTSLRHATFAKSCCVKNASKHAGVNTPNASSGDAPALADALADAAPIPSSSSAAAVATEKSGEEVITPDALDVMRVKEWSLLDVTWRTFITGLDYNLYAICGYRMYLSSNTDI